MSSEQERHEAQQAFVASGAELEVGDPSALPLPLDLLLATKDDSPWVVQRFSGGLTAEVWHLRTAAGDWTLKRARQRCLVQNVDGQTSFLNEIQRRSDIERLKRLPGGAEKFAGIVDTVYGSFRKGILLSPWIAGAPIDCWDAPRLTGLFDQLVELLLAGLFEWDLCAGNLLDDGRIRLFDFGYMYRFDPLTEFNSNGTAAPIFHAAERFETRNYFSWLLDCEQARGMPAAIEAFRSEKRIALAAYERLLGELRRRGATTEVIDWYVSIIERWKRGLAGDLAALYLAEGWRSHRLDLADDLHGQTCTRRTLLRTDWLIAAVRDNFDALRKLDAFFWQDSGCDRATLLSRLADDREKAAGWLLAHH